MTVAVIAALGCATPAHAVHVVRIASFPTSQLAVESARLNGDTIDDLAVASNCVVTALAGHGDGTYSPSASVTLAPCGGDRRAWLATGDVDGDGKQDVVVSVQQAQVWVLSGRGDGTFAPAVSYPTATGLPAYGVTVGDLNGDRRDDVAFVEDTLSLSSPSDIGVLVAQAGGGFAPAARYAADFRKATDLTTGHFDNDPFLDVAVGGEHCTGGCVNSVISFPGNGDGTFGQPHFAPTNLIPTGLLAAPLRGLARDDIAVTGNRVQSVLTDAEGALTPLAEHRDITGGRGDTGDLDGDGAPDLALAEPSLTARISLFLGDGAGDFDVEADLGFPSPSNFYDTQIVDADRDGWPDVVAAGAGEVDLIRNAPVAGLDPEALDFGTVPVGARSGPRTVTVYNGGVRPVQLAAARVDGPFAIASDGC
ncbi:MAG TPA: VCBS repeat-containing protein, partial [Solirubrobacter sp.]